MMSRMEFVCKLSHCEPTKKISGFNSIKELYSTVARTFSIPVDDILFCTLNSHDFRDMNALLGTYLSIGDLIVVHLCGNTKDLTIRKTEEYLGVTITDNGNGRAFVKRVKPNEDLIEEMIKPGDHIAAINSESTVGLRHYEVAKALREIPRRAKFTLHLIEPLQSYKTYAIPSTGSTTIKGLGEKPEHDLKNSGISLLGSTFELSQSDNSSRELMRGRILESPDEDLLNSSLPIERLLSKGVGSADKHSQPEQVDPLQQDSYRSTIDKINSILESFLGINDNTLAIQIYRLARENEDSFNKFIQAIRTTELSVFKFGEDIETYLWNCATGAAA